jgi:hypothetical protein
MKPARDWIAEHHGWSVGPFGFFPIGTDKEQKIIMKTEQEIQEINKKRVECFKLLAQSAAIMEETECSLGKDIIIEAVRRLKEDGCHEY